MYNKTGFRRLVDKKVVPVETLWTLIGKRYQLDKGAISAVVRSLIGDGAFRFESSQVVWSALMDDQDSKPVRDKMLDFVDALIVHKASSVARKDGQELKGFYSFDKAVGQLKKGLKPLCQNNGISQCQVG